MHGDLRPGFDSYFRIAEGMIDVIVGVDDILQCETVLIEKQ